ncbi:uncharacterized protein LOC120782784 [Bactrocera tryoni]|uniref:uncharacterized protein LOC120782784 n=1 Tax=Bactrocera tryoni TaxID=59916 RepID=UPI001A967482|nr:uncharacterized protein LOC120782784 [Bactrocera tryoni]
MLAKALNRIRQKRIILIATEPDLKSKRDEYLSQLFQLCEVEKMLNVVAIPVDFPQTKVFYSYTIFPKFHLEEKTFGSGGVEVFPRRLKNLHGYGIRSMPDQILPHSFAYELDGRVQVGGYLVKVLQTFATSINATLFYPLPIKINNYDPVGVAKMSHDNVIDIPISSKFLLRMQDLNEGSSPFAISDVCLMTPIKWYRTIQSFYEAYADKTYFQIIIVSTIMTWTLCYCCRWLQYKLDGRPYHETVLSAFTDPNYLASHFELGKPARLPRLVTLRVIVVISMLWTLCVYTHFSANLNTFVTKPATVQNPKNWDDFNRHDFKILISANVYKYMFKLCGDFCENTEQSWVFVDTLDEFHHAFYNLNNNYAYPVDLFFWHFVELKMRSLKQPVFRLSDMCLRKRLLRAIHLPENSIFKEHLNLFLTRCADHGLYKVWLDSTHFEMEKLKIYSKINTTEHLTRPLDLAYFSILWKVKNSYTLTIEAMAGPTHSTQLAPTQLQQQQQQ